MGHATRCIPIITSLLAAGYTVLLGSDGAALALLRKEFPSLPHIMLPSYNITYTKSGRLLKWKLLLKFPSIKKTMREERKIIQQLVSQGKIDGIISDNRLGVYHEKIPSIYLTHQLQVLSGSTTTLSSSIHQKIISKFTECWVPDVAETPNLSGTLGHLNNGSFPVKYIGLLSRMRFEQLPKKYDVLCLLSGPEPQRSLLEKKIKHAFQHSEKKVALVQGLVAAKEKCWEENKITVYNFLQTTALEKLINQSLVVVSRSGYTTIMDLAMLEKPAFFIPTPGQFEQQYLASRLEKSGLVPYCKQSDFSEEKLKKVAHYKGLTQFKNSSDLDSLFGLFERK